MRPARRPEQSEHPLLGHSPSTPTTAPRSSRPAYPLLRAHGVSCPCPLLEATGLCWPVGPWAGRAQLGAGSLWWECHGRGMRGNRVGVGRGGQRACGQELGLRDEVTRESGCWRGPGCPPDAKENPRGQGQGTDDPPQGVNLLSASRQSTSQTGALVAAPQEVESHIPAPGLGRTFPPPRRPLDSSLCSPGHGRASPRGGTGRAARQVPPSHMSTPSSWRGCALGLADTQGPHIHTYCTGEQAGAHLHTRPRYRQTRKGRQVHTPH